MPQPWELYQKQTQIVTKQPWEQFGGTSQPEVQPGFLDRASERVGARIADVAKQLQSGEGGRQNPLENAVNIVGDTAAMFGDVAGEGIKSAYNSLPDMITGRINAGAKSVGNYVSDSAVGDVAGDYANRYRTFAENNPRAAKLADSAANIALNVPLLKAAPAVGEATGNALSKSGQAIADSADKASVLDQITPKMINDATNAKYLQMRTNGAVINQQGINDIQNSIKSSIGKTGTLDPVRHSDTASVLNQINEAAKSGNMDLEQLDGFRQQLNEVIADNKKPKIDGGGLNSDGMKAQAAKNGLDDAVKSLGQQHLVNGNTDAFNALNEARGLYSAKMKLDTVNRIVEDAGLTDNPATSIKTGFRNLYKSIRANGAGWTPEEVSAIKYAADTGLAGGAVKIMGSRIIAGVVGGVAGAAGGGILGGIAGTAIGEGLTFPMRKLSNSMQGARAAKVADLVMGRPVIDDLAKTAVASGQLAPKFTALKALGVTMDKAGQLMRGGKPFTMKEAMQLSPQAARPVIQEIRLLESPEAYAMRAKPMSDSAIKAAQEQMKSRVKAPSAKDTKVTVSNATGDLPVIRMGNDTYGNIGAVEKEAARPENAMDRGIAEYHNYLDGLVSELNNSNNGGRFFNYDVMGQGGTPEMTAWASGNPDWFKNSGFTKTEVSKAVDAIKSNKTLGSRQRQIKQILDSEIQSNFEKSLDPRFTEDIPF